MRKLIIGCASNYDWSTLQYWCNSINQTGFDGDKVKFYESPEEVFMPTISNKPKLEKRVGVSNAKPF